MGGIPLLSLAEGEDRGEGDRRHRAPSPGPDMPGPTRHRRVNLSLTGRGVDGRTSTPTKLGHTHPDRDYASSGFAMSTGVVRAADKRLVGRA